MTIDNAPDFQSRLRCYTAPYPTIASTPKISAFRQTTSAFHFAEEPEVRSVGALSQETRLDIFRYLVQLGAPGAPAGQIGEHLGLPSATLSFHLNTLKQAGLVHFRRKGRSLIYTANFDTMNNLLAYLTENCCAGQAEVCAITSCEPGEATHDE